MDEQSSTKSSEPDSLSQKTGGTEFIEGFELLEKVGSGAMSTVYRAREILLDRIVAIKVLNPGLLGSEEIKERFANEVKAASCLSHPAIVQIFSCGTSAKGSPYIVMELLHGESLEAVFLKEAPLNKERFAELFLPVLDALVFAHEKRILHRDLKPANIMILSSADGWPVKLLDFGIAKILDQASSGNQAFSSGLAGSPSYMSPEQCVGARLDYRSDIYSLACVMYEALSGKAPFLGESSYETMYGHMKQSIPGIDSISGSREISAELLAAVMKALSKEPSGRQQSMSDFKDEIVNALGSTKYKRRRSSKIKSLALAAIVLLFFLASAFVLNLYATRIKLSNAQIQNELLQKKKEKPEGPAAFLKAKEFLSQKLFDRALIEVNSQIAKINKTGNLDLLYDALVLKGRILEGCGTPDSLKQAESCYQGMMDLFSEPNSVNRYQTVKMLAGVQEKQKKIEAACDTYEKAIKASELDGGSESSYFASLCYWYAVLLSRCKKDEAAFNMLKKSLGYYDRAYYGRSDLDAVEASWLLHDYYLKKGMKDAARSEIMKTKAALSQPQDRPFGNFTVLDKRSLSLEKLVFGQRALVNGYRGLASEMLEASLAELGNRRDPKSVDERESCLAQLAILKRPAKAKRSGSNKQRKYDNLYGLNSAGE